MYGNRAAATCGWTQLVITKVYEDGDQDLLENEDESEIRDFPDFEADLDDSHRLYYVADEEKVSPNWSSVQERQKESQISCDATFTATSMNSLNLPEPMRRRR